MATQSNHSLQEQPEGFKSLPAKHSKRGFGIGDPKYTKVWCAIVPGQIYYDLPDDLELLIYLNVKNHWLTEIRGRTLVISPEPTDYDIKGIELHYRPKADDRGSDLVAINPKTVTVAVESAKKGLT